MTDALKRVLPEVQQNQGWIEVAGQRGEGAALRIFLPTNDSRPKGENPIPDKDLSGVRERILLVEDDAAMRNVLRKVLEKAGYQIQVAASGDEALEVWKEHASKFDLLLTDIVMPGDVDGKELAQRLQSELPELKMIFMSGGEPYNGEKGQSHGYFLQKPFSVKKLTEIVRSYLDSIE
jgi:two-component system, cell cycle sensor histidine kinase and response regulator CckA